MTKLFRVKWNPNELIPLQKWQTKKFPSCKNVDSVVKKYGTSTSGSKGYEIHIIYRKDEFKIAIVVTDTVDIYAITQKDPSSPSYEEMMGIINEIIGQ